ncbi:unnamed protein product, partial [Mesorhabditis belari]|uniref:Protein OS9-like domain-containing protein n=1 Tax=Mesorhabditis belari TaxID=2138241 RepID=A0AAF3FLY1_9BILA
MKLFDRWLSLPYNDYIEIRRSSSLQFPMESEHCMPLPTSHTQIDLLNTKTATISSSMYTLTQISESASAMNLYTIMARYRCCFGFCRLRVGGCVIAAFSICMSVITLCLILSLAHQLTKGFQDIFLLPLVCTSLFQVASAMSLIVGILIENHLLILPFIANIIIQILLHMALTIIFLITSNHSDNIIYPLLAFFSIFIVALYVWFMALTAMTFVLIRDKKRFKWELDENFANAQQKPMDRIELDDKLAGFPSKEEYMNLSFEDESQIESFFLQQIPSETDPRNHLITNKAGQKFLCQLPDSEMVNIEKGEINDESLHPKFVNEIVSQNGWWDYEFCHGKKITQSHSTKGIQTGSLCHLAEFIPSDDLVAPLGIKCSPYIDQEKTKHEERRNFRLQRRINSQIRVLNRELLNALYMKVEGEKLDEKNFRKIESLTKLSEVVVEREIYELFKDQDKGNFYYYLMDREWPKDEYPRALDYVDFLNGYHVEIEELAALAGTEEDAELIRLFSKLDPNLWECNLFVNEEQMLEKLVENLPAWFPKMSAKAIFENAGKGDFMRKLVDRYYLSIIENEDFYHEGFNFHLNEDLVDSISHYVLIVWSENPNAVDVLGRAFDPDEVELAETMDWHEYYEYIEGTLMPGKRHSIRHDQEQLLIARAQNLRQTIFEEIWAQKKEEITESWREKLLLELLDELEKLSDTVAEEIDKRRLAELYQNEDKVELVKMLTEKIIEDEFQKIIELYEIFTEEEVSD